jgi:hypothetical protein
MTATLPGARPAGSVRTALRLAPLFARRASDDRAAVVLPVAGFAVVTALLAVVVGGAQAFFSWEGEVAGTYQALAVIALALLLVPLGTVGASAARLAARRRDDRLASLRLLGATRRTVTTLTVVEAAATALVGALAGLLLYAALAPLVGLLHFGGEPLGAQVWLPLGWLPLVVALVTLLAAAGAMAGLRAVVVTPLGVRTHQRPGTARRVRAVVAVGVLAVGVLAMLNLSAFGRLGGMVAMLTVTALAFGGMLLALDAVGPWWVKVRARRRLRKAGTVARLMAARLVLEDPRTAWRQVRGVSTTSFVGVFGGVGLAMTQVVDASNDQELWLFADISTGVLVTMTISFLMVACSVGIDQAATTLDRARVHVSMDRLGVPRQVMVEATRRSVMSTLWSVAGSSALCAVALLLPVIGYAVFTEPVAMATFVVVFGAGFAVVRLATGVAARLVPGILARPARSL